MGTITLFPVMQKGGEQILIKHQNLKITNDAIGKVTKSKWIRTFKSWYLPLMIITHFLTRSLHQLANLNTEELRKCLFKKKDVRQVDIPKTSFAQISKYKFSKRFINCIILIVLSVSGCKKADIYSASNGIANNTQNDVAVKVLAYIETEKVKASTQTIGKKLVEINLLREDLDFNAVRMEQLDNSLNFLIVPIKNEVINKTNLNRSSTLVLLLITDNLGKINSGSIVYFQPSDGKKHFSIPQKTFTNMFSRKPVALDGVYKMLTMSGTWISQFEIKRGKLFSAGTVQQKDKGSKNIERTNGGYYIDWYLVTTYYWDDGTVTSDELYLGTTWIDYGGAGDVSGGGDGSGGSGVGGDGNFTPEDLSTGQEYAATTTSNPVPSANSDNPSVDGSMIEVTWWATVTYVYNRPSRTFLHVTGGKPYPVPVSQGFVDDNGSPAVVYYSAVERNFSWFPISSGSVYCIWNFISIYNYVLSTGPKRFTFPEGCSKVVTAM